MTTELIAIITSSIALAGLMIGLFCCLRQEIRGQSTHLNNGPDTLSNKLEEQNHILCKIRDRLARLEGLIDGLSRPQPIIPSSDKADEQNRAA